MLVFVNDAPRDLAPDETTVAALMRSAGLPSLDGVAVAVNDGVVPRPSWENRALVAGDRVLVIRATQGG